MKIFTTELDRQIESFVAYKANTSKIASVTHREWLLLFSRVIDRCHVFDITREDVERFENWVVEHYNGQYPQICARRSVRGLLFYYKSAILMDNMEPKKSGRKIHWDKVEQVQDYVKKGLKYREIKAILDTQDHRNYSLRNIWWWANKYVKEGN